jgi:hydroxymethylbilane synthase
MTTLRVGTRGSALALTQTGMMMDALRALHPGLELVRERITTKGDVMTDVPLATIGGRGVFVDAIEEALRERRIDLAVHSAKDVPSRLPADMRIGAFPARVDARDALISPHGTVAALPAGARVGTSSRRRACQLLALRPDLVMAELRGNVDTRLRRLDEGAYDAIVLAGAGLVRLGLAHRVTEWIALDAMIPAPSQGSLAIELRADDAATLGFVAPLDDRATAVAVTAERAFLARLGAGCSAAVAAHATLGAAGRLTMRALIGAADGRHVRAVEEADAGDAATLGAAMADRLLAAGGATFLEEAGEMVPVPGA